MDAGSTETKWQRCLRSPWVLAGIFVTAVVARLAYLLEMRGSPLYGVLLLDGQVYHEWAGRILAGDWYGKEVFYQAPLYPYVLSIFYGVFGHDPMRARIVQAIVGSASCVLLAIAARRLFTPAVGALAGFMMALYGPLIFFDGLIQKPVLDVFFTSLLLLLLATMLHRQRTWLMVATGITLGLFALSRENALVVAPIIVVWIVAQYRAEAGKRRLAWVVALGAGLSLVLIPAGLRNRDIGGEFLVTTAQLGPNLYIGNHRFADGTYSALRPGRENPKYERIDAVALAQEALGRPLTPGEVSRYWTSRAVAYVREYPGEWLALMGKKWMMVWNAREFVDSDSLEAYVEWSAILRTLTVLSPFGIICSLAAAGGWLTRRRWRDLWILYAILIGFVCSTVAFYVLARYRTPMVPLLIVLSAAGLVEVTTASRADRARYFAWAALACVATYWPLQVKWDPRAITYQNTGIELLKGARKSQLRGELEESNRAYRQGEDMFARVLQIVPPTSPPAAEAHKMLGLAYDLRGRRDAAIEQYRQSLAISPQDAEIQDYLADLYAAKGMMRQAVESWQMAAQLAPADHTIRAKLQAALAALAQGAAAESVPRDVTTRGSK